ncbi:MAG: ATP-binding protein [Acidobacteria bacterium]|jgi:PAS domain S-box-containing protein|nr:ATP-binding protein [Acidobacteriota bacterium]
MRFLKPFILLFLAMVAIFAVALTAIYRDVRQQTIQELNARQRVHADQAAQGIQHHMAYIIDTLDMLAHLPEVIAMDASGERILSGHQARHATEVKGVTRLDRRGRIIYTTPPAPGAIGMDISYQAHVREILDTHQAVISDVFMAVQGFRAIAVHVPVLRDGAFDGTVAFLLSFDVIAQQHIENIRVGASGYAWVISREGFEISSPLPGHVGKRVYETCRDYPEIIAMAGEMMKGREGVTSYYYEQAGSGRPGDVLKHAVYRPIRIGNTFWSIVVATPENEVLLAMAGFRSRLLALTLALLVLSTLFTSLLVRSQIIIREQKKREPIVKALQESEESFRRIFDESADPILLLQGDVFVECNRAALALLGNVPREALIHAKPADISPPRQPDGSLSGELSLQKMREAFASGHQRFEWVHLKADGTELHVDVSLTPIVIRGENMLHVAWRDITERKRAEEEQERLRSQLMQAHKMESIGRLAGGVAHDFNNMLQSIQGYAEVALGKVSPVDPLHGILQEILKAGKRSADLTRQLLAFARKQVVNPLVLDLNDIIPGMLQMLQRLVGEQIDLVWMPGHCLWHMKMDPSQVDQILANLVVNARDAIAGSGRITIETGNRTLDEEYCIELLECAPGEFVTLTVSDTGRGMEQEIMTNIFEPFFTTKGVGQGTGLGLATVYGIVRQNDGFISVRSQPGQGAAFTIHLPRVAEPVVAASPDKEEQPLRKGSETVLLVEDNPVVLDLGIMLLQELGYRVLAARTPQEALQLAGGYPEAIDLLITDVIMPGINGRELADRLGEIRPELRCLFMSGYMADVIASDGVLDKGVHFIQKPFSVQALAEKVREALAGPAHGAGGGKPE